MGQNFSGVEKLRLEGSAGTIIQVRTGEVLNADGTLYTDNLRTAKSTDHFILAGKRNRRVRAAVHLPRLPLSRTHRPPGKPTPMP
jgi:hypothetical protein